MERKRAGLCGLSGLLVSFLSICSVHLVPFWNECLSSNVPLCLCIVSEAVWAVVERIGVASPFELCLLTCFFHIFGRTRCACGVRMSLPSYRLVALVFFREFSMR